MAYDLNLSHSCYLPNTEQRIERLKGVINKRPVAIILHGYSATELEERITELKDCDICYASVSRFWVIEKYILSKIDRNLSIVMCSADPSGRTHHVGKDIIVNWLERQEDSIFISTQASFDHWGMNEFTPKYDKKLLFHTTVPTSMPLPDKGTPLHIPLMPSLSVILSLVLIGGASKVAIFGGDGGRISPDALYFREAEIYVDPDQIGFRDTKELNENMPGLLERVYKIYGLAPVDIVNCSVKSHYTPFRKLTYSETFDFLRS